MFNRRVDKICESLYNDVMAEHHKDFLRHITNPWKFGDCPIPTGQYDLVNFVVEDTFIPPYMPGHERWLVEMKVYEGEELMGGYMVYLILRNEQSLIKAGGI